jgi:hypothetical protein
VARDHRGAADRLAETAAWIAAVAARWDGRVAAIAAVAEDRDEP